MTVPLSGSLALLWPIRLLLGHCRFEELIACLGSIFGDSAGGSGVRDVAKILVDLADNSSFLPRFTDSSYGCRGLVQLPSTFRENPAIAAGRLDEKNSGFVRRQRDNASNQPLALGSIACSESVRDCEAAKRHTYAGCRCRYERSLT